MPAVDRFSSPIPESAIPVRFTVEQFDRLLASGEFAEGGDRRTVLHRGEIQRMTPPNPPHDDVIGLLTAWAFRCQTEVPTEFEVRVQLSMDLRDQASVPSPDLMLVRPQSYSQHRPTAADTYLLIEVSDSSLSHDLGDKMRLYAEAGVLEYWVIDIPHRSLVVHTEPRDGRYCNVRTMDEGQTVSPGTLPGLTLRPTSLFR